MKDPTLSKREVCVCVCTFRRPHVLETLRTIDRCDVPDRIEMRIVVVDNDTRPSAMAAVTAMSEVSRHDVRYVHRPGANISLARNAALAQAEGSHLVCFVDDDERVERSWLRALVARLDEAGCDVVLGPVTAIYGEGAPAWMQAARIHDTHPVWVDGTIRTGYAGNVMMRMDCPALVGRLFDVALGRTGGEDTAFFWAAYAAGAVIDYAPDAVLEEDVPAKRATMSWLLLRRYRSGQTHGTLLATGRTSSARFGKIAVAGAKVIACAGLFLVRLPWTVRGRIALLRGALHVGTVSGLAGTRTVESYGGDAVHGDA